jgi:hypothetical protein
MSGGSYEYIYSKVQNECDGRMYDAEMNDFIKDFANVLHDLEWWQSGDSSEDRYRETLAEFKSKWFGGCRDKRLKGYVDERVNEVRKELYQMLGNTFQEEQPGTITCKDCNNHGIDKRHPDIDGARYCPTLHTYTGFDYYCGDAERREE